MAKIVRGKICHAQYKVNGKLPISKINKINSKELCRLSNYYSDFSGPILMSKKNGKSMESFKILLTSHNGLRMYAY